MPDLSPAARLLRLSGPPLPKPRSEPYQSHDGWALIWRPLTRIVVLLIPDTYPELLTVAEIDLVALLGGSERSFQPGPDQEEEVRAYLCDVLGVEEARHG